MLRYSDVAKDLRAQWSKLTGEAQATNRKTQELLQALKEHEGTDGLMVINFREPKCRSTILLMQAEHCMKRAMMLEQTGLDIGEWVDVPIAGLAGDAWNPPWAQATAAPEPRKPFLPENEGWPTELPRD
jgi:hypothetical protein